MIQLEGIRSELLVGIPYKVIKAGTQELIKRALSL